MGVLIRDMEIPRICDMCGALDDYGDYPRCRITGEQRGYNFPVREKRMDNCPLEEIPPHGRLIDADKLMTEVMDSDLDHLQRDDWREVIQIVQDAPTIIDAEE